jgi:hypothetical protein
MSEKSSIQSVSESYRSRGAAFTEDGDDLVDTNQVQAQNASEHAGGLTPDGEEREPVTPPEGTTPNTVNEGAGDAAATRPADEHQPDSGQEDPTVISGEGEDA